MIKVYLLLYCTTTILCLSCTGHGSKFPLSIAEKKVLDSTPSGSGIVLKNDTAYIIGDDATGIYVMSLRNLQQRKIPIRGADHNQHRRAKSIKHDFESATLASWKGDEYLLAFGSGSTTILRDSMLMLRLPDFADTVISLQNFYSRLRILTLTDGKEWNIEGATVANDLLILFNRGNNLIIQFRLNDFISYLFNDNAPFPAIRYHRVKLPSIEKHGARLSGVCTLDDTHILFSAAVEDTPDWVNDGPVLGSFIGIYSLPDSTVVASYLLQDETGSPLKEKIESLDILQHAPGTGLILIAVGDNDNGTSSLFRLKLQAPILKELPLK
jgi:hypothetical protein